MAETENMENLLVAPRDLVRQDEFEEI